MLVCRYDWYLAFFLLRVALALSTFLPVGVQYAAHMYCRERGLSLSVENRNDDEVDAANESEDEDSEPHASSLDATEWKNQDHYKLLGLGSLRWKASEDDIKKACKCFFVDRIPQSPLL